MIATLDRVTYTYPARHSPALRQVQLTLDEGRFVVVAGPSAGGKSTFLRLFNGLVPQFSGGRFEGRVSVCGRDATRTPSRDLARTAGMVFQDPEAQSIVDRVEDEIAFALEQRGLRPSEMRARIDGVLRALAIEHLRDRRLTTLSGGERQRVAIVAVLALGPRLLLLDEPTSQLDPDGAELVVDAVQRLHREQGLTTLVVEHRLDRLLPLADDVVHVADGAATRLAPRRFAAVYAGAPAVARLGRRLGLEPLPLTPAEARATHAGALAALRPRPLPTRPPVGAELIGARGLELAYGPIAALRGASLVLKEGEILALMGPNASGKSSLLRTIVGLAEPRAGALHFRRERAPEGVAARSAFAGLVPQQPALALYQATVAEEIADSLTSRRSALALEAALARWGLTELAERDPRDLSVGQQQRVAIAAMLAHEPPVWLLDEPTRGADPATKAWLAERLRVHTANGGAAIVATHDVEAAAAIATRVVRVDAGRVDFDLPAAVAFGAGGPLPTQVAQLVPGALLPEDVLV